MALGHCKPLSSKPLPPWSPVPLPASPPHAHTGGRVSDSYDRRVLTTYLDEYMGDFLFDACQPFHFYAPREDGTGAGAGAGGGAIDVPAPGPREGYLRAIEALPLVQSPEVGGGGVGGGVDWGWVVMVVRDDEDDED